MSFDRILFDAFVFYLALKPHRQVDIIRDLIIEKLPTQNYNVLKYLIEFLNLVRLFYIMIYQNFRLMIIL